MTSPLSPPPANPYAPPGAVAADLPRAAAHAPGRALAAMYAGYMALSVGYRVVPFLGVGVSYLWWRAGFTTALGAAHYLIVLSWVFLAWKGVPASHRGTMTPWRAVLTFFIPFYNLYWAFAMNVALCNTLDGILVSAGSERRAPRTLAIVASAMWVSFLGIDRVLAAVHEVNAVNAMLSLAMGPVTPSLWFAYMLLCDRAREAVARLGADPAALGEPRLSRVQRKKGPHPVAAIAVSIIAIVGFLGCWQLLQPAEPR
jgi:hypothetical protein